MSKTYRILYLFCYLSLIFILEPQNPVILLCLLVPAVLTLLINRSVIKIKDLTFSSILLLIVISVITLITGSYGKGKIHFYVSLLLLIPAAISFIDLSQIMKTLLGDYKQPDSYKSSSTSIKEKLFTLISSVFIISFMSTSSPLYPMNYWDDANLFLTLGRGILSGLIPYKDLYEQKGPALYFIHSICALIPGNTYTGMYILEILFCFIFLLFSWKITKLFVKTSGVAGILILLPFASIIYSSNMFHFGDSAEELSFPLLTIIIFFTIRALRQPKAIPSSLEVFIIGLITGIIFWIKFTFCGFVFGFVLFFVIYTVKNKMIRELLRSMLFFVLGFLTVTIPILLYFLVNDGLTDLFTAYFYNNIFLYSSHTDNGGFTLSAPLRIPFGFAMVFRENVGIFLLLILSLISSLFFNKEIRSFILISFVCILSIIFINDYVIFYYGFILMMFTPFILIPTLCITNKIKKLLDTRVSHSEIFIIPVIAIITAIIMLSSKNLYLLGQSIDQTPQKIFSQEICKTEDPKVLTYDVMDSGFFNICEINPSNKYFCFLNIEDSLTDILDTQQELIDDQYFDYIITYSNEYDWEGYNIIMESEYIYPYADGNLARDVFYLYRREATINE